MLIKISQLEWWKLTFCWLFQLTWSSHLTCARLEQLATSSWPPSETRPQPHCHCFFESYPNVMGEGTSTCMHEQGLQILAGVFKRPFYIKLTKQQITNTQLSPLQINAILGHWQAILRWRVFNHSHNWRHSRHFVISHHHASHQLMSYAILIAEPDIYLHHVPYCFFSSCQSTWVRTLWNEFPHS